MEVLSTGTTAVAASVARSISGNGTVGGWVRIPGVFSTAFLSTSGDAWILPPIDEASSEITAVNDAGMGVGTRSGAKVRAFTPEQDQFELLETLGGEWARAWGINAASQIVGASATAEGLSRPVVWEGGHITDLGGLGGQDSPGVAFDINAFGTACGQSDGRAVLFTGTGLIDLTAGTSIDTDSLALALNETEAAVGWISKNPFTHGYPAPGHGAYWREGNALVIGDGFMNSTALDINNAGEFIGALGDSWTYFENYLFRDGVFYHLDELLEPGAPLELREVFAINDAGQIAGQGWNPALNNGCEVAYVLHPVPGARGGRVATPEVTPLSGNLAGRKFRVTIKCATPGAEIRWTHGVQPVTSASPLYEGPLTFDWGAVISAKAFKRGLAESLTATVVWNLEYPPAEKPILSPPPGAYQGVVRVTMKSRTRGAELWVSTDGATPHPGGWTLRNGESILLTSSTVVKVVAIAERQGFGPSEVVTGTYSIGPSSRTTPAPVISPAAGTYPAGKKIKITCPDRKAKITYASVAGPQAADPESNYTRPFSLARSPSNVRTISARAIAPGSNPSPIVSVTYTVAD